MNIAAIGLGNRGYNYLRWLKIFCRKVKISAICDKNEYRLSSAKNAFSAEQAFLSDIEFFKEKRADAVIIATQDRDHVRHCRMAIDAGYKNILMEKPVSPSVAECKSLLSYADEHGATVVVCHVLRYSKYYLTIKKLLDDKVIGDVVNINHTENVGYFHFAHSYVRGNWRRDDETSPFIMAKCCHDFDLLYWFVGERCKSLSSIGSLSYFKKDNAPIGSTETCVNCKCDCPYNAEKLYLTDSIFKATFVKFLSNTIVGKPNATKEEKRKAIENGPYGRCVFRSDNNVADNQTIAMDFGDVKAVHTATAFSSKMYRRTQISGTLGEIIADDLSTVVKVNVFHKKSFKIKTKPFLFRKLGHVDGDINLIRAWVKMLSGEKFNEKHVTFLKETIPSHEMAEAAEFSRLHGGEMVHFTDE